MNAAGTRYVAEVARQPERALMDGSKEFSS
jgi:hypothetical protein